MIGMIRAFLVLLLLAAPVPVRAADYVDKSALDELFAELRSVHDAGAANDIVAQIRASGSIPTCPTSPTAWSARGSPWPIAIFRRRLRS